MRFGAWSVTADDSRCLILSQGCSSVTADDHLGEVRFKEHFPLGSLTLASHTYIITKKAPLWGASGQFVNWLVKCS